MRISSTERKCIVETVRGVLGSGARVRLFGSRVDDAARGGDLDLMVEVDHAVDQPGIIGARVGARLQGVIGDRRIDVVIAAPNLAEQPIHRVARESGIEL